MTQRIIAFGIVLGLVIAGSRLILENPIAGSAIVGIALMLAVVSIVMNSAAQALNGQKRIIAQLTAPKVQHSKQPISREKFEQRKTIYKIIHPYRAQRRLWKQITAILETDYPRLPRSEKTLREILEEGNAGLLDHWPPDPETTNQ